MVAIATKVDIKNERECESPVIKKWAEAEKGIFMLFSNVLATCTCADVYGHIGILT